MDDIADDEFLLRHIPGGTLWQAPGPRITSANFQLRHDRGESGVSVTRLSITKPKLLLQLVGAKAGSRVAAARAGEVHAIGLRVVPKLLGEDPGHAEIQCGEASPDDHACRKRLSLLFHFLPEESIFEQGSGDVD